MNTMAWVDPRVSLVKPAAVESYMLSHGWKGAAYPRAELMVFDGQLDDDKEPIILTVPSSERLRDYRAGVIQLITALSVLEDRYAVEVLNDMLKENPPAPPAPVAQEGTNGPVRSS